MARVDMHTWGRGTYSAGKYAVQKEGETAIDAVCRSLARRNRCSVLSCRHDVTLLVRQRAVAHHYQVTLAVPVNGGGWLPVAEVWISIPTCVK